MSIEEVTRFRPKRHREEPKRYFLPKIIKTPSTARTILPIVKQENWYELRLYLPKDRLPTSQFFKAGCHTESSNIAQKLARKEHAIHFELGMSSLKDVIPEEVRNV